MNQLPDVNKREVTKICRTLYDMIEYGFSNNVKEELLHFDDIGNLIKTESVNEELLSHHEENSVWI